VAEAIKSLKLNSKWILIAGLAFAGLNALMVAMEFFYLPLLPVALAIVFLALFSLDKLVILIVFLTPLSVNLTDVGEGVGLSLPTDPLMFGVLLVLILKFLLERKFDSKVSNHPITLAIMMNLIWLILTSFTSELPIVSFKFVLSRLWFLASFYFVATQIFKDPDKIKTYIWAYILGFTCVIIYTIVHHGMYGFEEQPAHWVMDPFFNDHTSYGAALAFFFPLLIGFGLTSSYSRTVKIGIWSLILLFTVALILSYTRAAWVSLVAALGLFFILKMRIKFSTVALIGVGIIIAFFSLQETIIQKLESNRQDSSAELGEHVQSISNISTDASNLERLNRWSSAFRLFEARPFVGWGPGTYAFVYAPFQHSQEKTSISTNAGDKGNAHSEYIGPLAEAGIFGSLSFIIIVICICYYSVILYGKMPPGEHRTILLCMFLGLVTYMIHGMLNNFLDTDKASAPFWGFTAAIVALDIYYSKKELKEN
jgi:putative inorganic carbon (HCO3(-)) transporter